MGWQVLSSLAAIASRAASLERFGESLLSSFGSSSALNGLGEALLSEIAPLRREIWRLDAAARSAEQQAGVVCLGHDDSLAEHIG